MTPIEGRVGIGMASWLALDIGGAHLKAAHTSGAIRAIPFELWRRPGGVASALADLAAGFPPFDRVAVTMTAELCDCFETKAVGVRAVLESVEIGIPGRPVSVWGTDGRFHDPGEIRRQPSLAAASNWLALAVAAAAL